MSASFALGSEFAAAGAAAAGRRRRRRVWSWTAVLGQHSLVRVACLLVYELELWELAAAAAATDMVRRVVFACVCVAFAEALWAPHTGLCVRRRRRCS